MPKLTRRVTLPVTAAELAALRWKAKQLGLKRYEHRKPSAAGVLRHLSLADVVAEYRRHLETTAAPATP